MKEVSTYRNLSLLVGIVVAVIAVLTFMGSSDERQAIAREKADLPKMSSVIPSATGLLKAWTTQQINAVRKPIAF